MDPRRNVGTALAGLLALLLIAAACVPPPPPPTLPSGTVQVSGSPVAVNTPNVMLALTASEGVAQVRLSNSLPITSAPWRAFTSSASWQLSSGGDGNRSVYAQFRSASGDSPVVETSVLLDTTPPDIAIQSPVNGSDLDLAGGDPFALSGTASDGGSGVEGVEMVAGTPPETFPAEFRSDGSWFRMAGAPTSGRFTYSAVARDRAGNVASTAVTVDVEGPPAAPIVQRTSALELSAAQANLVRNVSADRDQVVFAGDQRSWLDAVSTVFAGPIGTVAPDGLLVRVKSTSYDPVADLTVATTEQASFFDAYSRYLVPQLPSVRSAPSEDRCESFASGRSLSVTTPEVRLKREESYDPANTSITASASVELAARAVAVFDQDIQVDIGWGGIDVQRLKLVAGAMLCGKLTGEFNLSVEQVLSEASKYGIDTSGGKAKLTDLLTKPLGKLPKAESDAEIPLGAVPIPGTPLIVKPTLSAGPFAEADLKLTASAEGQFSLGFLAGWDDGFVFDPAADGQVTRIAVTGQATLKAGFKASLGVTLQGGPAFAKADKLFTVEGGGQAILSTSWENDEVSATGGISSVKAEVCSLLKGGIGIKIDVGIDLGFVDVETTLLEATLADAEAPRLCPFSRTFTRSTPPAISTESVPNAVARTAYEYQLETTADSPAAWRLLSGELPLGLALRSDGLLTGVPNAVGRWEFTVEVADSLGQRATKTLQAKVDLGDQFSVGSTRLGGTVGQPLNAVLETSPTTPRADTRWTVTSGTLPPGVSVSVDGALVGAATTVGEWTFTVQAEFEGRVSEPGAITFRAIPVPLPPLTGVVNVGAAHNHTCAATNDGRLRCWGKNQWGQLGNGSLQDSSSPVPVVDLNDVVQVDGGFTHTCALVASGEVFCWGHNQSGQLGDGGATGSAAVDQRRPVKVVGLSGVTKISAGWAHTCALTASADAYCWGNGLSGQLGQGLPFPSSVPVAVSGLSGVVDIHAGRGHTCAVVAGGEVRCWGSNSWGQLGNGSFNFSPNSFPVRVAGISGATRVVTGFGHTCAIVTGGTVRCWGLNSYGGHGSGFLGDGTTVNSLTPVTVVGLSDATAIDAAEFHTCVIVSGVEVRCWGANGWGQLGDGTFTGSPTPVRTQVGAAKQIATNGGHTCAVDLIDRLTCWGGNESGQLGDSTTFASPLPVAVGSG